MHMPGGHFERPYIRRVVTVLEVACHNKKAAACSNSASVKHWPEEDKL